MKSFLLLFFIAALHIITIVSPKQNNAESGSSSIVVKVMQDDVPSVEQALRKEPSFIFMLYGGKSLMFFAQSAKMVDLLIEHNLSPNEREPDTFLTPLFTVAANAIPRLCHHGARLSERVVTRIGSLNALEFALNEYLITDCLFAFERAKALYLVGARYRRENLILFHIFEGSENRFSTFKVWEKNLKWQQRHTEDVGNADDCL